MLKYAAVAAASKVFSVAPVARRAYRSLGNVLLERSRLASGVERAYVDRAHRLVELCDRHGALRPGDEALELGTGWLHWEATVLRLFYDVRVTLFDVWDNRLFAAYQSWIEQLGQEIRSWKDLSEERREHAGELIAGILATESFEELYAFLGFRYVLESSGRLDGLPTGRFALVVSADVLEHIPRDALPEFLASSRERLAPGGYAIHQIDLVDHYHYFDTRTSPKHFYRYDDRTWNRWFSNHVQYVNRVQRPEWRGLFDKAGFERVAEHENVAPLGKVEAVGEFAGLRQDDVDCLQMITVHRRAVGRDGS